MLVDYSEHMLGQISPCILPSNKLHGLELCDSAFSMESQMHPDDRRSASTRLPDHVLEELKRVGIPVGWYNHGELQDMVLGCAYDRTLIDDEDGHTLKDKLSFTYEEKLERQRKKQRIQPHGCEEEIFSP
jgi:hypothetical protein